MLFLVNNKGLNKNKQKDFKHKLNYNIFIPYSIKNKIYQNKEKLMEFGVH